jgi:hypothetical protein
VGPSKKKSAEISLDYCPYACSSNYKEESPDKGYRKEYRRHSRNTVLHFKFQTETLPSRRPSLAAIAGIGLECAQMIITLKLVRKDQL